MNKRYKCSYCDKTYASRQGKSRHQKTCINKPINTEEQLVNLNIENNNIEIENLDVHVIDQNNNSESVVKTAIESDDNEDEDQNQPNKITKVQNIIPGVVLNMVLDVHYFRYPL